MALKHRGSFLGNVEDLREIETEGDPISSFTDEELRADPAVMQGLGLLLGTYFLRTTPDISSVK